MKNLQFLALVAGCVIAFGVKLHSQAPATGKTTIQQLQDMKTENQLLLEKQNTTLQKLDEMIEQARTIKTWAKRA